MKILHTTSMYDPNNVDTRRRMAVARMTWEQAYRQFEGTVSGRHQVIWSARRTSRALGDDRTLPFVKDLIGWAFDADPSGGCAVMLTNADTCIMASGIPLIMSALESVGCYYSLRHELRRFDAPLPDEIARRGVVYAGADLFAFTHDWWVQHCDDYPDMLLGAEAWDGVLKVLIGESGFAPGEPVVYHESHEAYWSQHLLTSPSQVYNRSLAREWIERRRIPDFLCSGVQQILIVRPPSMTKVSPVR